MAVSFLAVVYEHTNRKGRARLMGLPNGNRYRAFNIDDLEEWDLQDLISSADVYGTGSGAANLLLFEHDGYRGAFRQLVRRQASGPTSANLTDVGLNDKVSSILLVRSAEDDEFRLSFRDLFLQEWKDRIDPALGSQATRQGDPVMTWEMFPEDVSFLSSTRTYLKIHQNLRIDVPWWPDYDASITYHIELYRNAAGRPRGVSSPMGLLGRGRGQVR